MTFAIGQSPKYLSIIDSKHPSSKSTSVSATQLAKAEVLIVATLAGIRIFVIGHDLNTFSFKVERLLPEEKVMEDKAVHPENAETPIVLTLAGMLMAVKLVQLLNADSPIDVNASGSSSDIRPLQEANAELPMV